MAVYRKQKAKADFNMSSLTDIIFLLLIFFMLTSSMVTPNALNLQLPGRKSSMPKSNTPPVRVAISANNGFSYNGEALSLEGLEKRLVSLKKAKGKDATLNISPSGQASNESVVAVMDIAYRYEIRAVLNDPQ
ncbi:MAG: biopolymer transporter ExbD [Saprospiraceae bacterium]|jgi:biopolymer transport protein ExbD|nr:biopolymer transporter ExbD [Saprospiraceae bacterium]MBP9194783.1 biopolymer transporter ExbD [Saprospiraceae bacterium]